jgi:hypothetical protein
MKAQICFAVNITVKPSRTTNGRVSMKIEDRVPVYLSAHVGIVDILKRQSTREVIFEAGGDEGIPAFLTPVAQIKKRSLGAIEAELGAQVRSVRDEIARLEEIDEHGILSKKLDRAFERQVELAQIRKLLRQILFGKKKRYNDGFIIILPS